MEGQAEGGVRDRGAHGSMNLDEFVHWLDGYLTAGGRDMGVIRTKLKGVTLPEPAPQKTERPQLDISKVIDELKKQNEAQRQQGVWPSLTPHPVFGQQCPECGESALSLKGCPRLDRPNKITVTCSAVSASKEP
jgi:hypothetical protein